MGRDTTNAIEKAHAQVCLGTFGWLVRNWVILAQAGENIQGIAKDHNLPYYKGLGATYLGCALTELGDVAKGLSLLESGTHALRASYVRLNYIIYLFMHASAYRKASRFEEAIDAVDQALCLVEESSEKLDETEINRLKAELVLARDPGAYAEAETIFLKVLQLAHDKGDRLFELRTATSLARLRSTQGRYREALSLLAPLYAGLSHMTQQL